MYVVMQVPQNIKLTNKAQVKWLTLKENKKIT